MYPLTQNLARKLGKGVHFPKVAMLSQEIRRKFLDYFKQKGHTIVPSSPVIPHDDPTLLFTNAGMNQFKDVFLGKGKRDYTRATTSQKCIRVGGKHNDLDNVGHTARHLTFFEMMGNFSFGDYFKKEAIAFAWEACQTVLDFDPKKLWVTVFEEDDEAYELWQEHISTDRIVRMDAKENFWAMGDTGPCGPCSELYYDRGEKYGPSPNPKEDPTGDRSIEFWNLVFMQFNRDVSGKMNPLPNQSVDTGGGLERIIALKLGVDNVFHTDILIRLIEKIADISGKPYDPKDQVLAPAYHVIADHLRSLSFAIADGAQPSNIERGYVLRKLLRRAVRYGRTLLGVEKPFLADALPLLVEMMGADFPELKSAEGRIGEILTLEEEGFLRTLKRGGSILQNIVEKAVKSPHRQISGEDAFKLKDTYGFPLEEILLIAKDSNLEVNIDAYQLLEEKAKELSRSSRSVKGQEAEESEFAGFFEKHGATEFVGFSETEAETELLGIVQNGAFVDTLPEGEEALLLLKTTPFYAEKGGQVGDTGMIDGFVVSDTKSPYPDLITHVGYQKRGMLDIGDKLTAEIDWERRKGIQAHHTATHLLHYALHKIVGDHVKQAGSLVEANRLRFDFNHHKALSQEEIREIEDLVNEKIRGDQKVSAYELSYADAQKRSDINQFFGEKYGATVRVVDIDYSKELCGGCHVDQVGKIGYFRITKESSIAAGVRRIEASCGRGAEEFVREEENRLDEVAHLLKTDRAKVSEKAGQLLEEQTRLKQQLRSLKKLQLKQLTEELTSQSEKVGKTTLLACKVEVDSEDLADLADHLIGKMEKGVVALAISSGGRAQLLVRVDPALVKEGIQAGKLIKEISPHIGGGGGGRPEMAQAGGKNPEGIEKALSTLKNLLSSS